jgi:hypothetical protein
MMVSVTLGGWLMANSGFCSTGAATVSVAVDPDMTTSPTGTVPEAGGALGGFISPVNVCFLELEERTASLGLPCSG